MVEPTPQPEVTQEDICKMFYLLLAQGQQLRPGSKISFDLRVFEELPKKLKMMFEKKNGRLFAWIPEKKKKKSNLVLPRKPRIITN